MSKIVLTSPQELTAMGFTIDAEPTLLDDPLYLEYRKVIDRYIAATGFAARPPWEYQRRYAAMAACRRRNLLAHEQGLGKTYETVLAVLARYGSALTGAQPALRRGTIQIVAPRHTLKLAWLQEFARVGLDHLVDVILTETDVLNSTKPIWLLGYDLLKQQTTRGRQMKRNGRVRIHKSGEQLFFGEPMWRVIRRVARPHMVIFDEIHSLRKDSDRTAAVLQYRRGVKNRLGLTGTPVDGWVGHLATILNVIYGESTHVFPWTEKSFTDLFTRERMVDLDYVTGESGQSAAKKRKAPGINPDQIPAFYEATKHLMHRLIYRDPEVSGNVKFPPVTYHVEKCALGNTHGDFYYGLHEQVVAEIARAVAAYKNNPLNANRLRQNVLTQIGLLRRAASCPWGMAAVPGIPLPKPMDVDKVTRTIEICLKAKAEGRKVIVFTNFVDTGRILTQALKQAGVDTVRVYASDKLEKPVHLDQDAREDRIERFLEDPGITALVGNLGLLSTGLTMVEASVIVNFDHDWRANTYKQGISRVVRPGGRMAGVDVYDLLTVQTVDIYVFTALMNKVKATAEMIDRQFNLENLPTEEDLLELDPMSIAQALLSGELQGESA
mgnify:CR=1 FL=1